MAESILMNQSGKSLPGLTNPASPNEIIKDYEAIDQEGEIIVGNAESLIPGGSTLIKLNINNGDVRLDLGITVSKYIEDEKAIFCGTTSNNGIIKILKFNLKDNTIYELEELYSMESSSGFSSIAYKPGGPVLYFISGSNSYVYTDNNKEFSVESLPNSIVYPINNYYPNRVEYVSANNIFIFMDSSFRNPSNSSVNGSWNISSDGKTWTSSQFAITSFTNIGTCLIARKVESGLSNLILAAPINSNIIRRYSISNTGSSVVSPTAIYTGGNSSYYNLPQTAPIFQLDNEYVILLHTGVGSIYMSNRVIRSMTTLNNEVYSDPSLLKNPYFSSNFLQVGNKVIIVVSCVTEDNETPVYSVYSLDGGSSWNKGYIGDVGNGFIMTSISYDSENEIYIGTTYVGGDIVSYSFDGIKWSNRLYLSTGSLGSFLPKLENPAKPSNIIKGYQAIGQDGAVITGTKDPGIYPKSYSYFLLCANGYKIDVITSMAYSPSAGGIIIGEEGNNSNNQHSRIFRLPRNAVSTGRAIYDIDTLYEIPSDSIPEVSSIICSNSLTLIFMRYKNVYITTTDGINFVERNLPTGAYYPYSLRYPQFAGFNTWNGTNRFILIDSSESRKAYVSLDGINWSSYSPTYLGSSYLNGYITCIICKYSPRILLISPDDSSNRMVVININTLNQIVNTGVYTIGMKFPSSCSGIEISDNHVIIYNYESGSIYKSNNAMNANGVYGFTEVYNNPLLVNSNSGSFSNFVEVVNDDGTSLINIIIWNIGSNFSAICLYSTDAGETWQEENLGNDFFCTMIAYDPTERLYFGTSSYVDDVACYSYDGIHWSNKLYLTGETPELPDQEIALPTLTNPASAINIDNNKQAIDQSGSVIIGTSTKINLPSIQESEQASASDILIAKKAIDSSGQIITGTYEPPVLQPLNPAASASNIDSGYKAYDSSGNVITGTSTKINLPEISSSESAAASDVISGKKFISSNGSVVTGILPSPQSSWIAYGTTFMGVTGTYNNYTLQSQIPEGACWIVNTLSVSVGFSVNESATSKTNYTIAAGGSRGYYIFSGNTYIDTSDLSSILRNITITSPSNAKIIKIGNAVASYFSLWIG